MNESSLWLSRIIIIVAVAFTHLNGQDWSACCNKAVGTCRSVCEKMSLVEIASDTAMREERIQHIYKFCSHDLIEFWICMNTTVQEVVNGSAWWGRACCALGRSANCRHACATVADARALVPSCRVSDEIALFDCVQRQQEAQWCCSQTLSITCHEACGRVLWRSGQEHVEMNVREKTVEACEQSPELLHCFRNLTRTTVAADTSKYLSCCHESSNPKCRSTCEAVLRQTSVLQEIAGGLADACGTASLHDSFWQCFLRKGAPADAIDSLPHDAAKLHCCFKAATLNCRRLCFLTFGSEWLTNWQKFYGECFGDSQEDNLSQCIEEVEAPCSLGCSGLTYCSELNNRPRTLFRACSAHADLDAHLAVAEQSQTGIVQMSGLLLPLRNSSQCPTSLWKNVACALHVKPCTFKGHSSLICEEDCRRLVSKCVDWGRTSPQLTVQTLCSRLIPNDPNAPCVSLRDFIMTSTEPPLLLAREAITSPCSGAPCNKSQMCAINRNCLHGGSCSRYVCLDACPLGEDSPYTVPYGSWARVPMPGGGTDRACYKICRCGSRGLTECKPLPCFPLEGCSLHDRSVPHGTKYYMECNVCICYAGEKVCSRRACRKAALLTGLPCNCPLHHLPVSTPSRTYPNACIAKCAGAIDAEIEFGPRNYRGDVTYERNKACLTAPTICLSRLQTSCPQFICVNTTGCNLQPQQPVCDTDGQTHFNPCYLLVNGRRLAYWGPCLLRCSSDGVICGINGVTYISECAAFADYASVDYSGPCLAVGPISDTMEQKCQLDRIRCPAMRKNCLGFTAPGSCCPKCGGALRILYSKKQIDRALYATNISATVINLRNVLKSLERLVKIAECSLRGYLTFETEIFVSVESVLKNPTELQMHVCVLEAEKIADLINRDSALISSDLSLSALSFALIVHSNPINSSTVTYVSLIMVTLSCLLNTYL